METSNNSASEHQTEPTKVMLDSEYWIDFKDDYPEQFEEFVEIVDENNIEVLFSYGNFIDLIKRKHQDRLSEMISRVVSTYITPQDYVGDSYSYSDDPVDLVPEPLVKERVVSDTEDFGEVKTLRYLFRVSDWEGLDEYIDAVEYLESVRRKMDEEGRNGDDYVQALLLDIEEGKSELHYSERGTAEVISTVVQAKRIQEVKQEENIDFNDVADMEICTHAILTNTDVLVIESKWKNAGIIESSLDRMASSIEIEVIDEIEMFMDRMRNISSQ